MTKPLSQRTLEELVQRYVELIIEFGKYSDLNVNKKANPRAKAAYAISEELKQRGPNALMGLVPYLDHENPYVRCYAACTLLPLLPEKVILIVEQTMREGPPFLAGSARLALQRWRAGEIQPLV